MKNKIKGIAIILFAVSLIITFEYLRATTGTLGDDSYSPFLMGVCCGIIILLGLSKFKEQ